MKTVLFKSSKINGSVVYGTSKRKRVTGQGLTEYIIIVALIALASIAAVKFFGSAVQGAFGGMALVLGGESPQEGIDAAKEAGEGAVSEAGVDRNLGTYVSD